MRAWSSFSVGLAAIASTARRASAANFRDRMSGSCILDRRFTARALLCYIRRSMTKLFEKGVEAVKALSAERQDMAGELLFSIAESAPEYRLTTEQIEDLKLAIAEADRGEFATDEEMAGTWTQFGL